MICLERKRSRFRLFVRSVSPGTQVSLLPLDFFGCPKQRLSPQYVVVQEITEPEESNSITRAVCLSHVFSSSKFEKEVVPVRLESSVLSPRFAKRRLVILISVSKHKALAIPQNEMKTL